MALNTAYTVTHIPRKRRYDIILICLTGRRVGGQEDRRGCEMDYKERKRKARDCFTFFTLQRCFTLGGTNSVERGAKSGKICSAMLKGE